MPGTLLGLLWAAEQTSSTGRPSNPPLALTSSRQSSRASRFCLPLGATAPVRAMLKPTLIGSAARTEALAHHKAANKIASEPSATRLVMANIERFPPALYHGTDV